MFYHFSQNNSGGSFHFDENKGITHHVIIEADKASYANADAEDMGMDFSGAFDCSCCGNRWHKVDECNGEEFPAIYGSSVEDCMGDKWFSLWMKPGKEVCVHYKDGRKEWF
jgi:hypothetical protein